MTQTAPREREVGVGGDMCVCVCMSVCIISQCPELLRSWTTSIAQARFIKNPGYIPAVKIEAAYLLHFAQINLKTCESYPLERWGEEVNSLRLTLRSGVWRRTKMQEGHRRRALQDACRVRGFGEAEGSAAIFSTAAILASDRLFSFLYFIYTLACAHTHARAYILKSFLAYATPVCGSLWFSRCCSWRWHLTPIAAAFSWDSITACLAKADWFFKDNIFWGGIIFFPPKKQFLLRKERHDLQLDLARCWMPPDCPLAPSILFYFSTFYRAHSTPQGSILWD